MITVSDIDAIGLWEAWVDLQCTPEAYTLYVVGDILADSRKLAPVLIKKNVQGAAPSHLYLEVMPCSDGKQGRLAEVGYTERIADINQYRQISICSGEDVIAMIADIEVLY